MKDLEPGGRVLVEHRICRVTRHGPHRLEARIAQRSGGIVAAGVLGTLGLAPLVLVPILSGGFSPAQLTAALAGLPFVALSWLYVRNLSRSWGLLTVDHQAGAVTFTQDDHTVGTWPLSAVIGSRETLSFSRSRRARGGQDRWLKLSLSGGGELPVLLGHPEELAAIRAVLSAWGIPELP